MLSSKGVSTAEVNLKVCTSLVCFVPKETVLSKKSNHVNTARTLYISIKKSTILWPCRLLRRIIHIHDNAELNTNRAKCLQGQGYHAKNEQELCLFTIVACRISMLIFAN